MGNHFSFRERGKSFVYAFNGIKYLLRHEHNAWLHCVAMILVIAAGIIFNIKQWEWCVVLLCIGMVFSAEAVNTAIEKLCDKVAPEKHPLIGTAKDVAAGAVLILAIISVIVALIIFLPYIINAFH